MFAKIVKRLKVFNYLCKRAPSLRFDCVLNILLPPFIGTFTSGCFWKSKLLIVCLSLWCKLWNRISLKRILFPKSISDRENTFWNVSKRQLANGNHRHIPVYQSCTLVVKDRSQMSNVCKIRIGDPSKKSRFCHYFGFNISNQLDIR